MIRNTWFLLALVAVLVTGQAIAAIDTARISPDIGLTLSGQIVTDDNVVEDDLSGAVAVIDIGAVPREAGLAAYHLLDSGHQLLVFDITVSLAGGVIARPNDVVGYDGIDYNLDFVGSDFGVPNGARIDALSVDETGNLLMSFDITTELPSVVADDEDLVRFNGVDSFEMLFDGSAVGIDPGLDVDAAHFDGDSGRILLSLDSAGTIDGVVFSDEDILQYDPAGGTWQQAYDGSAQHSAWSGGDLVALFVTQLGDLIFLDGFETVLP